VLPNLSTTAVVPGSWAYEQRGQRIADHGLWTMWKMGMGILDFTCARDLGFFTLRPSASTRLAAFRGLWRSEFSHLGQPSIEIHLGLIDLHICMCSIIHYLL